MNRLRNLMAVVLALGALPVLASSPSPISRFAQVTPKIYRGARPLLSPVDQFTWLKALGVRTDIDLQGGDAKTPIIGPVLSWAEPGESKTDILREKKQVHALGMGFANYPMNSIEDVSGAEAHRIDEVLDLMNNPAAQPVFVHCEHGVDRTGLVVALYRVKYQGWDIEAAHNEMVAMGHSGWHAIINHEMDDYFYEKAQEIVQERAQTEDEASNR